MENVVSQPVCRTREWNYRMVAAVTAIIPIVFFYFPIRIVSVPLAEALMNFTYIFLLFMFSITAMKLAKRLSKMVFIIRTFVAIFHIFVFVLDVLELIIKRSARKPNFSPDGTPSSNIMFIIAGYHALYTYYQYYFFKVIVSKKEERVNVRREQPDQEEDYRKPSVKS